MAAWESLLDFKDVQHEMMLENPPPSYEAMVRWCGRFPQYSEQIAERFVEDAVYNIDAGEPQELIKYDEDEIVMAQNFDSIDQRDYAFEVLRRRALEIPPRPLTSLDPFDRQVLESWLTYRGALATNVPSDSYFSELTKNLSDLTNAIRSFEEAK